MKFEILPQELSKSGHSMNNKIKEAIINLLSDFENDGLTQAELAEIIKISEKTFRNYLTADVLEAVRLKRREKMAKSLALIDRAVFAKAASGDLSAAKLVYAKWDEDFNFEEDSKNILLSIDEEIKQLDKQIFELENGKTTI